MGLYELGSGLGEVLLSFPGYSLPVSAGEPIPEPAEIASQKVYPRGARGNRYRGGSFPTRIFASQGTPSWTTL